MTIKDLINKLKTCDPDDNITFYYLQNDCLTNCQFENINWGDDNGWELTIQDTSELIP
tara:strand:- start:316 stop:489 length:174 start_codon:yes stop_codon:yes gene_type:complete